MQRQIHRHADHDGAQDAAAPEVVGAGTQHGRQAGVCQGLDQCALAHHQLGRDDGGQCRQRSVLQAAAQPVGQGQSDVQLLEQAKREGKVKIEIKRGDQVMTIQQSL